MGLPNIRKKTRSAMAKFYLKIKNSLLNSHFKNIWDVYWVVHFSSLGPKRSSSNFSTSNIYSRRIYGDRRTLTTTKSSFFSITSICLEIWFITIFLYIWRQLFFTRINKFVTRNDRYETWINLQIELPRKCLCNTKYALPCKIFHLRLKIL